MSFSGSLFALHGFLGQSQDWVQSLPSAHTYYLIDLFQSQPNHPLSFPLKNFQNPNEVFATFLKIKPIRKPYVMIGYSLGGRLLLQFLLYCFNNNLTCPADAMIFISTHPGLENLQEKRQRLFQDETWAFKFQNHPWNEVISEWNQQPVFQNSVKPAPQRRESEFCKSSLACALNTYSLGKQPTEFNHQSILTLPTLWIHGALDYRFMKVNQKLHTLNLSSMSLHTLPQSGHRLLWEQPQALQTLCHQWIQQTLIAKISQTNLSKCCNQK